MAKKPNILKKQGGRVQITGIRFRVKKNEKKKQPSMLNPLNWFKGKNK
jgi:hypothetical protein